MTVQAVASVFKDANILLGSKILAVAETIDSIASGRLLKVKLTVKQAIQNFTDDSRRRFDPNVVSYGRVWVHQVLTQYKPFSDLILTYKD